MVGGQGSSLADRLDCSALTQVAGRAENAAATGDARCFPTKVTCQLIELRKGESEFFDVRTGTGVDRYELDVDRVVGRTAATAAAALRVRRRESRAGRTEMYRVIRTGRTYVTDFMYSRLRGVLVARPLTHRAQVTAPGSLSASP